MNLRLRYLQTNGMYPEQRVGGRLWGLRAQGEEANVFVKSLGGGLERMNDDGGNCDCLFLVAIFLIWFAWTCLNMIVRIPSRTMYTVCLARTRLSLLNGRMQSAASIEVLSYELSISFRSIPTRLPQSNNLITGSSSSYRFFCCSNSCHYHCASVRRWNKAQVRSPPAQPERSAFLRVGAGSHRIIQTAPGRDGYGGERVHSRQL